jgi:RNA polymerase sigma-70 factor (ECF subfamily)
MTDETTASPQSAAELFESYRPLMFSIAYRMLGTRTDAEDILQKAWLRYQAAKPQEVRSLRAYISTIVTRLCLDQLDLARTQREQYIGPWLPEPIMTEADDQTTPARQVELHESLSIAFLTLLEQLTPVERAVFLLREVFDYDYHEIGGIVDKEEAACRKIFSRAKQHIAERRPRFKPTPQAHRQLLEQFVHTVQNGELDGLLQLLHQDVDLWADSGGKVPGAALRPLRGREAVARFMLASRNINPTLVRSSFIEINGEPAWTLQNDEGTRIVITLIIEQGLITSIRAIGNPDKLETLNRALAEHADQPQDTDQDEETES